LAPVFTGQTPHIQKCRSTEEISKQWSQPEKVTNCQALSLLHQPADAIITFIYAIIYHNLFIYLFAESVASLWEDPYDWNTA